MGPEARLERRIADAVHRMDGLFLKQTGMPGIPDRLVIIPDCPPRYIFLELKAERGRVSELQKAALERLHDLGCDARVLRGSDEVTEFIQELGMMKHA